MTTLTYAVLDGARLVNPDGTIYSMGLGGSNLAVTTPNDLSIVHADRAVAAGTSFSVEFLVDKASISTTNLLAFGLGDNNTTYLKTLEVRGASNLVKVSGVEQAGTGLAMPTGAAVRIDFYAADGRCVVSVNNAVKADVLVPSLVGRPIWVYGRSTAFIGPLTFRFGQAPFTTPVPYGLQGGVYSTSPTSVSSDSAVNGGAELNAASGPALPEPKSTTVLASPCLEALILESNYGTSYTKPLADLGRHIPTIAYTAEQKLTTVADTNFVFVKLLQGGAYSGGVGIGLDRPHGALVPTRSVMRTAALLRGSNTKPQTSAFEQMREEQVKPRVYWGDS